MKYHKGKLYVFLVIMLLGLFFVSVGQKNNTCQSDILLEKCKKVLGNFNYDLSEVTVVPTLNKEWSTEYQLLLFTTEKYKLIFNTEGYQGKLIIEVWSKKPYSSGAEKLFTTQNFPEDQKEFVFEPKRSNKIFVKYIAPNPENIPPGCVVMVLGYEFK